MLIKSMERAQIRVE